MSDTVFTRPVAKVKGRRYIRVPLRFSRVIRCGTNSRRPVGGVALFGRDVEGGVALGVGFGSSLFVM